MYLLFRSIIIAVFAFSVIKPAMGQRTDRKLERKLNQLITGFNGQLGIYVHDLKRNRIVGISQDTVFSTASMVKVPILIGIMDKLNRGELKYNQEIIYHDSLLYAGSDILGSFKSGEKIELGKVIMLMLTTSDNTASLWLQNLAGTGSRINNLIDSLGFKETRVNSRTPGRESIRSVYGWGQTTPKEMATIMERIVKGEIISDSLSQRMLRLLGRNFWDDNAIAQVPADVFVASKNGAVNKSRSEVLFVNGRGRRYVFCVCTQNNNDESWNENNEAWVLTRKISKLLWEHN
ncbi:serine hydrolase [Segetibacter sp. 3557_3]|uniref:serine hydrolase n=1 Tax=Segetibacter sp. 3557_3 TaxID=2547429 RepID=UPI0010589E0C|nr:serine hydrolase [Segetibacter sp. 3557_3]TDH19708.1 serine hydrolase [Segetibacter sp. 3557_3]